MRSQSRPTLCSPMDYSPPGFSVHGILQARILKWVAISFSRGSSQPRNRTLAREFFTTEPPGSSESPVISWVMRVLGTSLILVPDTVKFVISWVRGASFVLMR